MRLAVHEDGWIFGLFRTERKDPKAPRGDLSRAVAQCGIARTKDLKARDRLDDLKTSSSRQRNVVLHPEFVGGKYAFHTRPQDGFIEAGSGGGIAGAWPSRSSTPSSAAKPSSTTASTTPSMSPRTASAPRRSRPPRVGSSSPTACGERPPGLRYVLYAFMTAIDEPSRLIDEPGGYLLAPSGIERVGDVSNVTFSNGWVARSNGQVLLYYASSDTRCHVAATSVEKLVDYCEQTPRDPLRRLRATADRPDPPEPELHAC